MQRECYWHNPSACEGEPCLKRAKPSMHLLLQGELGKFGGVELSDISSWVELPSGKVLSGSEGGALLVWDDALVKAVVTQPGGAPCHTGAIEALVYDAASSIVITGGADGVLRQWDAGAIERGAAHAAAGCGTGSGSGSGNGSSSGSVSGSGSGRRCGSGAAEPRHTGFVDSADNSDAAEASTGRDSNSLHISTVSGPASLPVQPLAEVALAQGSRVRSLLPLGGRTLLVMDEGSGVLCVRVPLNPVDAAAYKVESLVTCQGGAVVGLATLPGCHIAVSAGADGSVRAVDYTSGVVLQARQFPTPATCMALLEAEGAACRIAVGFADGAVRVLQRAADGWLLLNAMRPHAAALVAMALSPGGGRAATVASDGTVFFFSVANAADWQPIGFCRTDAECVPTCASWMPDGQAVALGFGSGLLLLVDAPGAVLDTSR